MILTIPPKGKVAVIGAGVSGLSYAYFLNKLRPDLNIHIFEKKSQVGGWINSLSLTTKSGESILLEKGPRTLRGVSDGTLLIVDILKKLGHGLLIDVIEKTSVANKKYILDQNKELLQVPDNIASAGNFLMKSGLLKYELLKGFLKESLVPPKNHGDESIESFFKRRLGTTVLTSNVMSAIIHGIYAGDISKLSVQNVLPQMVNLERETGSITKTLYSRFRKSEKKDKTDAEHLPLVLTEYENKISPGANIQQLATDLKQYPMIKLQSGLQEFPKSIERHLKLQKLVRFHFDSNITSINPNGSIIVDQDEQKFDHIRSTIYTHDLALLLPTGSEDLAKVLNSLQYVNVFLVNIFSPKIALNPDGKKGFGFLVPKGEEGRYQKNPDCLLGVIFDSDVEQNAAKLLDGGSENANAGNKVTLMMGGHYYNNVGIPSNRVNLKITKKIVSEILKVDLERANLIIRDEESLESKIIDDFNPNDILISYNLHRNCIPQYNVGYTEKKKAVENWLDSNKLKLSFGGMAFGNGIGVPDCVTNALEHALKVNSISHQE